MQKMYESFVGGVGVYKPQSKDEKEFASLFSQLKPLNRNYALGILRSLFYAQELSTSEKNKPTDKKDNKSNKQE